MSTATMTLSHIGYYYAKVGDGYRQIKIGFGDDGVVAGWFVEVRENGQVIGKGSARNREEAITTGYMIAYQEGR